MEKSNKKILIIAIILSTITSMLIFIYLKKATNIDKSVEKVSVIVAARTIEPRTPITLQDIKEIEIDKSLVNSDIVTSKNDIVNIITKDTIYSGEQILRSRLSNEQNATLAFEIPKGKRAVTINVSEASAVGYFVNPGDFVDVIVTVEKEGQDYPIPTTSKTLLQNIEVLGVGQQKDVFDIIQDKSEKKSAKNSSNDTETIRTITLAVLPEDVEKIAISDKVGSIILSLRPVDDKNIVNTNGVTKDNLLH